MAGGNPATVYDFEWDPTKAFHNARKHGVNFDQTATVFLDALALTVCDERIAGMKNAGLPSDWM
jgi:uncharacterized DUF497 family protein